MRSEHCSRSWGEVFFDIITVDLYLEVYNEQVLVSEKRVVAVLSRAGCDNKYM